MTTETNTMTDNLPPLLPCPFCESSRLMTTSNGHDSMFVECEDCGSSGPAEEYEDEATAAWNRRAAIAQARSCVPAGMVLASVELLKRAESSLGSFCSDHGWGDEDMQTMDDISGLLAASTQPQPVQPTLPEIDYQALIYAAYKRDKKWAQGTNGCIAFKHGAEWFRDQVAQAKPEQVAQPIKTEAKLAQRVPDGWALVPVKPTEAMVVQGAGIIDDNGGNARWSDMREAWDAMLSAAPAAPEQQDQSEQHLGMVAQAPNAQQAEPPPWWPAVENILNEYGLQAVDFVADFKAAQQAEAQEPVATINISDDDFDLGLTDDYAFGSKRLPNGEHQLFTRPQPAQLQALSVVEYNQIPVLCAIQPSLYAEVVGAISAALAAKNGVNLK